MSFSVLFVESISDSGGSGFIDDSQNVESSNNSGIFGGLSLRVIEISGDGNNSVVDFFSEIRFSGVSHFGQDHGGDFFRVEFFDFSLILNNAHRFIFNSRFNFERPKFHIFLDETISEFSSDKSFSIEDGVERVSCDLIFSGISDKSFSFGETNIRGGGSVTLIIGNDFNFVVLIDSDT